VVIIPRWEAILVIILVREAKLLIFVRRAIILGTRTPSSRLGIRNV
jgi:hypothetical protein